MPLEQLLFLVLLAAIPLLERLIRAMRGGMSDSSGDGPSARNGGTGAHPRAPASIADAGTTPSTDRGADLPLPTSPVPLALPKAGVPAAPEILRASGRAPRVRDTRRMPMTARRTGQPERLAPGDLRRAIVLMTVLGPCRALAAERSNSHDDKAVNAA